MSTPEEVQEPKSKVPPMPPTLADRELAEAKRDGERAQQLRSDTTAELLVCRNAPNMLKKDIAPMAAQIICPKDNVMSRMVKTTDIALQATYSASRDASEPAARTP